MRRRIIAGLSLVLVVAIVAWLLLSSPHLDSPERHVARYLAATSSGDLTSALNEWSVRDTGANIRPSDPIMVRRNDVTDDLVIDRAGASYTITGIEWWRTCCTPDRIDDPQNAGLARVHVTTTGQSGKTYQLIFEVWVKDLTWWGDATGERIHDWRLYEVHYADQACVFPNPNGGCIHSFG